jgi:hypothetical protein
VTIILQDPTLERDQRARHAFPEIHGEVELRAPRTLAEDLLVSFRNGELDSETAFELTSHGGYARSVTGSITYLDMEANTFMVRSADGGDLMRVPLRDVTSAHATDQRWSAVDRRQDRRDDRRDRR